MMNAKDLLAKLLAAENISVIRAPVRTASFDVESRVLSLPQWKEMSEAVEEMLIGHEVGHALFTTNEYIKQEGYTHSFHGYMNVCEDVRIEKKIKNKYPGLRRTFIQGYKELNEKDFFDIKSRDLNKLLLIDRINLYFKVGFNCGVRFSPAEMDFVRRVEKTDTMADVYSIAKEIYDFTKAERKKLREELKEIRSKLKLDQEDEAEEQEELESMLEDEDEDSWDVGSWDDEELDEEQEELETETKTNSGAGDITKEQEPVDEEKEIVSHTDEAFYRKVEEFADTNTTVRVYEPAIYDKEVQGTVVDYKTVLAELTVGRVDRDQKQYMEYYTQVFDKNAYEKRQVKLQKDVEKFKVDSGRVVNYLVKEFEMRKSATQYKRTQTAKIGQLDSRKLAVYQLTDDLFRRIKIVPDAKNHGMIMLVDWSGSMVESIDDTLAQVINLAMFCQRAMIPYQVFAFTSEYSKKERVYYNYDGTSKYPRREYSVGDPESRKFFAKQHMNLLELFSNKMTTSEFNRMVFLMMDRPYTMGEDYGLGGTPLNEALLFLIDEQIKKFLKINNVQKMSVITLTDGQGGTLVPPQGSVSEREYDYNSHKSIKVKNYMRDPITHKEYALTRDNHTNVLLNIIRDRFNASVIGFHILRNSRRDIASFCTSNIGYPESPSEQMNRQMMIDELRVDMRKEGFSSVSGTGHDDLFLVSQAKMSIEETELEVKEDMNSRAIAKQFEKYMNQKKTSRILLNRFIGLVA
jgi:hypothetical protein